MLLFNKIKNHRASKGSKISIHPMLLFNMEEAQEVFSELIFQYIPCYYSTNENCHSCILLISINHDLKPFLSYFTNHSIENQLFVKTTYLRHLTDFFKKSLGNSFLIKNDIFIFCFINSHLGPFCDHIC